MKGFFFRFWFFWGGFSTGEEKKRDATSLSLSSIYLKIRRDLSIYLSGNEMSSCASARSPPYASYFHSLFFSWWLPHFVKAGNNNSPGPSMLKKKEREKKTLKKKENERRRRRLKTEEIIIIKKGEKDQKNEEWSQQPDIKRRACDSRWAHTNGGPPANSLFLLFSPLTK